MALLHALRQASWTLILPMQMGASPYWALFRGEAPSSSLDQASPGAVCEKWEAVPERAFCT